jgi:Cupin domain
MSATEAKSLDKPDETRKFAGHGWADAVQVGGKTVIRGHFQPGWRWTNDLKPIAGTELCEAAHLGYVLEGRMKVRMKDGSEFELGPGDAVAIEPGHDAWVVGNETMTFVDFGQIETYAKPS